MEKTREIQVDKNTKQVMIAIVVIAIIIIIAVVVGFYIYNTPENRLARALDLGQKYLLEEEYEQAIVEFNKALEIDPKNVDAYLGIADAYTGLENVEAAITVLEQGYELTENKEIWENLDELRNSIVETESAEIEESIVGKDNVLKGSELEEGEFPYYELGFSPEDFTLAGYSVIDGNHADDIAQEMDKIMLKNPDVEEGFPDNYSGWQWDWYMNEEGKALYVEYVNESAVLVDGAFPISYSVGTKENSVTLEIGNSFDIYKECNWPTDILSKRPLFDAKVTTDISIYEEVIDILGIREVIQQTNEEEKLIEYWYGSEYSEEEDDWIETEFPGAEYSVFSFESQFGDTECLCRYYIDDYGGKDCEFSTKDWSISLRFDNDEILRGIRLESL